MAPNTCVITVARIIRVPGRFGGMGTWFLEQQQKILVGSSGRNIANLLLSDLGVLKHNTWGGGRFPLFISAIVCVMAT